MTPFYINVENIRQEVRGDCYNGHPETTSKEGLIFWIIALLKTPQVERGIIEALAYIKYIRERSFISLVCTL